MRVMRETEYDLCYTSTLKIR